MRNLLTRTAENVETRTLNSREKYNMILLVALNIASLAAYHGTDVFLTYLNATKELEADIRAGTILPMSTSSSPSIKTEGNALPATFENPENGSQATASQGNSQERRFQFSFKGGIRVRSRPKRPTKQLSFNKTSIDRKWKSTPTSSNASDAKRRKAAQPAEGSDEDDSITCIALFVMPE